MDISDLLIIVPYNNPIRWRSRLANMARCLRGLTETGARVRVVELTYGDRTFEFDTVSGCEHIGLRTRDVLWHKENLVNIGLAKGDWEYAVAVDGDLLFGDPSWAPETPHALQLYPVTQVSTELVFLGPRGQPVDQRSSYVKRYRSERTRVRGPTGATRMMRSAGCSTSALLARAINIWLGR